MSASRPGSADLFGMRLARLDTSGLLDHLFASLREGRGGWLVTANLDFLRRYAGDPGARALYDGADLRVADGRPLVWALAALGQPAEQIAGSSLVWALAERAASEGRSLFLLGGTPAANEGAARVWQERFPALRVAGRLCPDVSSPPAPGELDAIRAAVGAPDLLLVGLGSPKQEQVIRALAPHLPRTWMIGVGVSFSFVAGELARAPVWMQRLGLEWTHRLAQEPRRLARRYLVDDLPFALRLAAHVAVRRAAATLGVIPPT